MRNRPGWPEGGEERQRVQGAEQTECRHKASDIVVTPGVAPRRHSRWAAQTVVNVGCGGAEARDQTSSKYMSASSAMRARNAA